MKADNREMKLWKNKKAARWTAVIAAAAVVGTATGVYCLGDLSADGVQAAGGESGTPTEEVLTEVLTERTVSHSAEAGKEETVYVVTDASGNTEEVIVSSWLKNAEGADELEDVTTLENIENVKGDETYTQGSGDAITWNAGGSDIYYQGTTDKELPVDVQLTYYLDGEEISPEALAGKSGQVTIRFDYTNHVTETVNINGKDTELYVPFAVISGMILPLDHFSNVSVTNGRIISEGNNNIVIGLAFPGLSEDLSFDSFDAEELSEYGVEVEVPDVEIPDYIEVSADVTDFTLEMTLSMVVTGSLLDVDMTGDIDLSGVSDQLAELNDSMDVLAESSALLVEGSGELASGADDLASGAATLYEGAAALNTGITAYVEGVNTLASGIGTAKTGADQLNTGAAALAQGTQSAKDGAYTLASSLQQLADGSGSVAGGVSQLGDTLKGLMAQLKPAHDGYAAIQAAIAQGMESGLTQEQAISAVLQSQGMTQKELTYLGTLSGIYDALNEKSGDIEKLVQGAGSLSSGLNQAADGAWGLYAGLDELNAGAGSLRDGAQALADGFVELQSGAELLVGSGAELTSGSSAVADGARQVSEGAAALRSGADTLYDGMVTFDTEGIQVLVDTVSGVDLDHAVEFAERLSAVLDAADDYTSFGGAPEGMEASVKFIIRTGAVK